MHEHAQELSHHAAAGGLLLATPLGGVPLLVGIGRTRAPWQHLSCTLIYPLIKGLSWLKCTGFLGWKSFGLLPDLNFLFTRLLSFRKNVKKYSQFNGEGRKMTCFILTLCVTWMGWKKEMHFLWGERGRNHKHWVLSYAAKGTGREEARPWGCGSGSSLSKSKGGKI